MTLRSAISKTASAASFQTFPAWRRRPHRCVAASKLLTRPPLNAVLHSSNVASALKVTVASPTAAIELLAEGMTLGDAAGLPRDALLQYLHFMMPGALFGQRVLHFSPLAPTLRSFLKKHLQSISGTVCASGRSPFRVCSLHVQQLVAACSLCVTCFPGACPQDACTGLQASYSRAMAVAWQRTTLIER